MRIVTNSKGLRKTKEILFEKPGGTYRILGLGDSITFGNSVDNYETFLKWIEREAKRNNKKVETINFGVPGFNQKQEYSFFKYKNGIKYSPDLIILALGATDFDTRIRKFNPQTGKLYFEEKSGPGIEKYLRTEQFSETKLQIKEIKEYFIEKNVEFIVVIFPSENDLFINEGNEDKNLALIDKKLLALIEILEELEIRKIDIFDMYYPLYKKDSNYANLLFWDGVHPHKFGHEIAGKIIYRTLNKRGYF